VVAGSKHPWRLFPIDYLILLLKIWAIQVVGSNSKRRPVSHLNHREVQQLSLAVSSWKEFVSGITPKGVMQQIKQTHFRQHHRSALQIALGMFKMNCDYKSSHEDWKSPIGTNTQIYQQ